MLRLELKPAPYSFPLRQRFCRGCDKGTNSVLYTATRYRTYPFACCGQPACQAVTAAKIRSAVEKDAKPYRPRFWRWLVVNARLLGREWNHWQRADRELMRIDPKLWGEVHRDPSNRNF